MPRAYKPFFLVVALFALWVGAWGFAAPAEVGRALPWTVTPLHARFIAAIYLAGLLAMVWSFFADTVAEVRIPVALASLWTGALLLVSMLHLGEFDFGKAQVAFWMFAYAIFPLWGGWLYFSRGAVATAERRSPADPALLLVAAVCLLLAAALLLAPAIMVAAWPWKMPPLLASIYAGPFFAYGVCAFMLAREARPQSRRIVLSSMLAFTVLALLASLLHRGVFRFDAAPAWVWFGGFLIAAAVLASRLLQRPRLAPS